MKWEEIDTTFPIRQAPVAFGSWNHQWNELRAYVEALLTHFARLAAGLAAGNLNRAAARDALTWAHARAVSVFGFDRHNTHEERDYGKGVCALLATALDDAELLATCSGKLPSKVQASKQFGEARDGAALRGLAKHLGTAARARLPASQVTAALIPLRDGFTAGTLRDPRVALVAAYIQFALVARVPASELPEATRTWIEGKPTDAFDRTPSPGIADGHDPRAMIFEQFAASLANRAELEMHALDLVAESHVETSDRSVFQPETTSNAATFLYLARQPLTPGWSSRVDPYVARWLGADIADASIQRRRVEMLATLAQDQDPRARRNNIQLGHTLAPAIAGLQLDDHAAVVAYTGGGKLTTFKAGKAFRDDWRKLLRYLAAATSSSQATPSDVEPAWFDFLSRPRTEWWSWSHLLAVQAVITVQLGHGDPTTVGRELQRVLTGA